MLTVILKLNHRKKCIQLLTFLLLFSLMMSVGAACLRPQIVYASVAGTIAGYILTLFASFNTAITNPEVVTAINNTFGQMSMIEADAALIDQGIASIAASTGFDMASIFATTAEEAAQVIASAPAGSALEGAEAIAATAGVNIAAGAGACAASATGAVLPAIGGLVIPAVGAVALGVAGGFLINHIREKIAEYIRGGVSISDVVNIDQLVNIPTGTQYVQCYNDRIESLSNLWSYALPDGFIAVKVRNLRDFSTFSVNLTNKSSSYYYFDKNTNTYKNSSIVSSYSKVNIAECLLSMPYTNIRIVENQTELNNLINEYRNKNENYTRNDYSVDFIGNEGNISPDTSDGGFSLPSIRPVYIYGENVVNYIDPSDYQDFINDANHNTDIGDTEQDPQGDLFDGFINPYISPVEDPSNPENPGQPENPDNPVQQPTVPYPDPEEYPDAIPEVNPIPETDIAPTAIPYPELPEPTDEEITETNDKITPFDLKNKFPFCLPFDIHKALLKLKGARDAPYFVWTIPFGDAGEQTVTVDLRAWDEVASILRLLELLLFIVGLAVATRNLIGGT